MMEYCADPNHNGDAYGIPNDRGCGNPECWKFKPAPKATPLDQAQGEEIIQLVLAGLRGGLLEAARREDGRASAPGRVRRAILEGAEKAMRELVYG